MKSMFSKDDVIAMKARLAKLTPEAVPVWGKMNVQQMICHLRDQMELALGHKTTAEELVKGPPLWLRTLIRLYFPIPRGKVQTSPGMQSTQPEEWEKDRLVLLELMDEFVEGAGHERWGFHPFFGPLTGEDWARLTWRHTNHHLKQFGV